MGAAEMAVAEAATRLVTAVARAAALARAATVSGGSGEEEEVAVATARVRAPVLLAEMAAASWAAPDRWRHTRRQTGRWRRKGGYGGSGWRMSTHWPHSASPLRSASAPQNRGWCRAWCRIARSFQIRR